MWRQQGVPGLTRVLSIGLIQQYGNRADDEVIRKQEEPMCDPTDLTIPVSKLILDASKLRRQGSLGRKNASS